MIIWETPLLLVFHQYLLIHHEDLLGNVLHVRAFLFPPLQPLSVKQRIMNILAALPSFISIQHILISRLPFRASHFVYILVTQLSLQQFNLKANAGQTEIWSLEQGLQENDSFCIPQHWSDQTHFCVGRSLIHRRPDPVTWGFCAVYLGSCTVRKQSHEFHQSTQLLVLLLHCACYLHNYSPLWPFFMDCSSIFSKEHYQALTDLCHFFPS